MTFEDEVTKLNGEAFAARIVLTGIAKGLAGMGPQYYSIVERALDRADATLSITAGNSELPNGFIEGFDHTLEFLRRGMLGEASEPKRGV